MIVVAVPELQRFIIDGQLRPRLGFLRGARLRCIKNPVGDGLSRRRPAPKLRVAPQTRSL